MKQILVTGALGQIGSELVTALRKTYGHDHVIATDIQHKENIVTQNGPFEMLDVTDGKTFHHIVQKYKVDTIIHLASLLSATAERQPLLAWNINMGGLVNALEVAKEQHCQFFTPSSIAAFGKGTPSIQTPQDTLQRPSTMYGVSKVAGELLCDYYFAKFGVDTRGVRFPGLISHVTPPGGGTTDYAVDMYFQAVKQEKYTSYIAKGTFLDMMYMPDALQSIIQLMEADGSKLIHRNAFNISAMSVDPESIATSIRTCIPSFQLDYEIDPLRQNIAESWPSALDTSAAQREWGFHYQYDLDTMTKDMISHLKQEK